MIISETSSFAILAMFVLIFASVLPTQTRVISNMSVFGGKVAKLCNLSASNIIDDQSRLGNDVRLTKRKERRLKDKLPSGVW